MAIMALAEENRTIPIRYSPATMITTARKIEQNRGIRHFRKKATMGAMTRENRKAMIKGRTMGAVIFKTAPPRINAIKATRKKTALPELKRLK
jgi:ribosomal protein L39E